MMFLSIERKDEEKEMERIGFFGARAFAGIATTAARCRRGSKGRSKPIQSFLSTRARALSGIESCCDSGKCGAQISENLPCVKKEKSSGGKRGEASGAVSKKGKQDAEEQVRLVEVEKESCEREVPPPKTQLPLYLPFFLLLLSRYQKCAFRAAFAVQFSNKC